MRLIHVIAGNHILILSAPEFTLCRLQLQRDADRFAVIIQTDRRKHLAAHVVADPIPVLLQIPGDA